MLGILFSLLGIVCMAGTAVLAYVTQVKWHTKLRALLEAAKQYDQALYQQHLARYDRIFFAELHMMRLTSSSEIARFGPACARLQREAQLAFRRVFLSFLPVVFFAVVMATYAACRR